MTEVPDLTSIFFYIFFTGLPTTLILTVLALGFGFLLGMLFAIMRVYGDKELAWIASGYDKLLRGIPILVLIFIFAYGIPEIFWYLDSLDRQVASIILALSLRSAAYQSQIFRGAILSVNTGQMVAARAVGMKKIQAFRYIILPQALRLAAPGWSNEYSIVIKDTSFAYSFGVIELTKAAYRVSVNFPILWAPTMLIAAILYFVVTYPVTRIFGKKQDKRLKELGIGGR
ncbi:MAG: amino acid ABC transporter permease [Promethearchaeota archaeon]